MKLNNTELILLQSLRDQNISWEQIQKRNEFKNYPLKELQSQLSSYRIRKVTNKLSTQIKRMEYNRLREYHIEKRNIFSKLLDKIEV